MDVTGIQRQQGYTTRLATNIVLHLLRGKTIAGISQVATTKNHLITKVYGILGALNLSSQLLPTVPGCYYTFTNGGSMEIVLEQQLTINTFSGKKLDCIFSDPGRMTLTERQIILPRCVPNFIFLDEHNVKLPTGLIIPPGPIKSVSEQDKKKISSR